MRTLLGVPGPKSVNHPGHSLFKTAYAMDVAKEMAPGSMLILIFSATTETFKYFYSLAVLPEGVQGENQRAEKFRISAFL